MRPRGRPKRSDIPVLIVQGMNSDSHRNQCKICKRTFPRMKNLNTHLSTHSDKKKYKCNFPNCGRPFHQSSQLKSHLFLHSNEKPFICPAEDCQIRFKHSNRSCPSHPDLKLIKQPENAEEIRCKFYNNLENLSEDVKNWFEEYLSKKRKISTSASVQNIHDGLMEVTDSNEGSDGAGNIHDGLMEDTDSNEGSDGAGNIHDGLMEITDSSEGSDSSGNIHDGLMEIFEDQDVSTNVEKIRDKNMHIYGYQDGIYQDGLLFYSFVNDLCKKGRDSKALFHKCIYAMPLGASS